MKMSSLETCTDGLPPLPSPTVTIPLYIYPSPGSWEPLHIAISENPDLEFYIILNPNNGPGGRVPDARYVTEIARLRMAPNTTLFGYVHISWGKREQDCVTGDISNWAAWACHPTIDIHVDGIFLDEAPSCVTFLEHIRALRQHATTAFSGNVIFWTNPGVPVDSVFYAEADIINACENTYDQYTRQRSLFSIPISLRSKTSIMVHDYSGSTEQLHLQAEKLQHTGFHLALITTDTDYTKFSAMWFEFLTALKKGSTKTAQ